MTFAAPKRAVRALRRAAEVALIERRYGLPGEASRTIWLRDFGYGDAHRNDYAPTPWRLLRRMLPVEDVSEQDVFLDLGCGYGRIVLEAAERYPFKRVIGVELVPAFADAARSALMRNQDRLRCRGWEIVTTDAQEYAVPDDVTVAYLFDPFTGPVFDAVLGQLERSIERRPRTITLVYLTPQELPRLQRLTSVRHGSAGRLRTGGRYEYIVADLYP